MVNTSYFFRFSQNFGLFHSIDNNKYLYSSSKEINLEILKAIKALGGEFEGMEIESMRVSLIKKEKSQLSIIYDFLDFQHKKQKIDLKSKLTSKQTNFQKNSVKKDVTNKLRDYRLKIINSLAGSDIKEDDELQNWRIGIICKKDCFYILTEVLKSLQNIGCEWMILSSSYKIKGRKQLKNTNISNDNQISFLIQIFSVINI